MNYYISINFKEDEDLGLSTFYSNIKYEVEMFQNDLEVVEDVDSEKRFKHYLKILKGVRIKNKKLKLNRYQKERLEEVLHFSHSYFEGVFLDHYKDESSITYH